jgi:hypothetical protein
MATRNYRPLGVEFKIRNPHQKKQKKKFTKNLIPKSLGGVDLHFGRRSAGSPFFFFDFFFLIFNFNFLSMKLFSFRCCKAILLLRA